MNVNNGNDIKNQTGLIQSNLLHHPATTLCPAYGNIPFVPSSSQMILQNPSRIASSLHPHEYNPLQLNQGYLQPSYDSLLMMPNFNFFGGVVPNQSIIPNINTTIRMMPINPVTARYGEYPLRNRFRNFRNNSFKMCSNRDHYNHYQSTASQQPRMNSPATSNIEGNTHQEFESWKSTVENRGVNFDLATLLASSQGRQKKNKKWTVINSRVSLAAKADKADQNSHQRHPPLKAADNTYKTNKTHKQQQHRVTDTTGIVTGDDSSRLNNNQQITVKIRGKEREKPAKKKPSILKRIIIQERNEQQSKRDLMDWKLDGDVDNDNHMFSSPVVDDQHDDKVDIEQLKIKLAKNKLHNRKFRSYCSNCLCPEIDRECGLLLKLIYDFQHRAYAKDQIKTRSKRRYIAGMRQVIKYTKANLLKCVVIAPNCEPVQATGGLDDIIMKIVDSCKEQNVMCVFALNRRELGKCLSLAVPVSAVGIIDYSGADVVYKALKVIVDKAQREYAELLQKTVNQIQSGKLLASDLKDTNDNEECDEDDGTSDVERSNAFLLQPVKHVSAVQSPSNKKYPSHTRNYSGTLNTQSNRLIVHGRNPSDIPSHTYNGGQTSAAGQHPPYSKPNRPGHSRNVSLISNISGSQADEEINAYQERILNEFIDDHDANIDNKISNSSESALLTNAIENNSDIDGDISNNESDDNEVFDVCDQYEIDELWPHYNIDEILRVKVDNKEGESSDHSVKNVVKNIIENCEKIISMKQQFPTVNPHLIHATKSIAICKESNIKRSIEDTVSCLVDSIHIRTEIDSNESNKADTSSNHKYNN
ncbi:hypothetical protein GJ496_007443 [Pomphorhynchus laevis]|nr:hypothetical protein GJ496_007443 [Pomphorhynchus laevis]